MHHRQTKIRNGKKSLCGSLILNSCGRPCARSVAIVPIHSLSDVLTFAVGPDRHATLNFDLSRIIARQIEFGQRKVPWHDERHRQRSQRRHIRAAQLPLLRQLCSIQSVDITIIDAGDGTLS